ncbi:hypothetical protein CPLU01_04065 [Colletotrichum plurivorum]|uniref:Uncharacterized protein n=1 Tax=Colletotrichum plurivorum TaxID=2175906 RepID=A0A8H6NK57_9PEZI|nr:hypothetical protein CPLU01_04065 [Colletotrichum plurivorum]
MLSCFLPSGWSHTPFQGRPPSQGWRCTSSTAVALRACVSHALKVAAAGLLLVWEITVQIHQIPRWRLFGDAAASHEARVAF